MSRVDSDTDSAFAAALSLLAIALGPGRPLGRGAGDEAKVEDVVGESTEITREDGSTVENVRRRRLRGLADCSCAEGTGGRFLFKPFDAGVDWRSAPWSAVRVYEDWRCAPWSSSLGRGTEVARTFRIERGGPGTEVVRTCRSGDDSENLRVVEIGISNLTRLVLRSRRRGWCRTPWPREVKRDDAWTLGPV